MQNRFKFRVWIKDEKRYSWLLNLFNCGGASKFCEVEDYDEQGNHYTMYEPDEVILEQCTGLKDKNGKLIYEGDIVKVENNNCKITWDNENARYEVSGYGEIAYLNYNEIEVIGNINQNPDLLENKDD